MRPFDLFSKCPTCTYGGPAEENKPAELNKITACSAKATEVPLRCQWCGDIEEIRNYPRGLFGAADGKVYRPVTKVLDIEYKHVLQEARTVMVDGKEETQNELSEQRWRRETVIDLEATLAAGPIYPPKTIKHVHRMCLRCGTEWPEQLAE